MAAIVVAVCSSAACGTGEADPERGVSPRDRVPTPPAARAGFVRFSDPAVGLTGEHPVGWDRARSMTNFVNPREVLVLGTFPLRPRAEAGECPPDHALQDLPPGGVFIWLLEYRPPRGDVWAGLRRGSFPPRPRFELRRTQLEDHVNCFDGPALSTTFSTSDRPFQLLVAFGGAPTDERLEEVDTTLNSLEFEQLEPPPPDPYAGWPMINDNPGDSLRPPPGWAATAAMFPVDKTPRPRALFFASNRPLFGLPDKLVPYVDRLPGPMPEAALANGFPRDGVLLWIVEESDTWQIGKTFSPIDREWPSREDFEPATVLTKIAPEVRWQHAGGTFRGYRFSVWIAAGPDASERDRELALKSGRSLAVSGCSRDAIDDCPDR